jgi:hypothetical protein
VARLFARPWLAAGAAALGLTGCAGTYDLITSERFKERPFHTLFTSEDPMTVLETVQDGDDRRQAMHRLKEPRENGGTQDQQDRAIAILQAAAVEDNRPLCRLAAVEALARFKDPRVGPILVAAYYHATQDSSQPKSGEVTTAGALSGVGATLANFTPDTITTIQCRSLDSLGEHRSPEGLKLLVEIATTPTEPKKKKPANALEQVGLITAEGSVGTSETDRMDVRLAAIRALGHYEKDATAIRALVGVLATERDVAVRSRTHESLVNITGQDLPPDGPTWQAWLDKGGKK